MHNFLKTAGAATLMGVLTMAGVAAEAGQIRATVPFSFEVNKQVLAPGTYTIDSSVAHGLVVRGAKSGAIVLGAPLSSRDSSPRLVFHRYGNEYILREVWMGGGSGNGLSESRRERELAAARGGSNTAAFERVEIPIL